MMPVALSRDQHTMATRVSEGEDYVLYVAGDNGGGDLRVDLEVAGQYPLTGSVWKGLDVNGDGWVSPLDALLVINALNSPDPATEVVIGGTAYTLDVDGSGYLSPRDALLIITYLNQPVSAEGGSGDATLSAAAEGTVLPDAVPRVEAASTEDFFTGERLDVSGKSVDEKPRVDADGAVDKGGMLPWDVNRDGFVSPADAALVINHLNFPQTGPGRSSASLDVSEDGIVSPLDALLLINFINTLARAEGEQTTAEPISEQAAVAVLRQDMVPTAVAEVGDCQWRQSRMPMEESVEKSYWSDELEDLLSTIAADVEEGWKEAR
jgi:hypothetical protein